MHEYLLVHHDNTPLVDEISNSIIFNPTAAQINDYGIDAFITREIIPQISNQQFDVICIRDTLSDNYVEFYGLILAMHIRLGRDRLKDKSLVPVIILSDTNELVINRLSILGRMLLTKNVILCPNNVGAFRELDKLQFSRFTDQEYRHGFLDLITILPPQDYLSHHSITNEWAIDKWATMLNVDTPAIGKNREKISSLLYYKFLMSRYQVQNVHSIKITKKTLSGRVLLIEDKWKDGWMDVVEKFLNTHFSDVELDVLTAVSATDEIE